MEDEFKLVKVEQVTLRAQPIERAGFLWEYRVVVTRHNIERDLLNQLGDRGWEMCGVGFEPEAKYYYFKRAKPLLEERRAPKS
jgi:hypothetical protein